MIVKLLVKLAVTDGNRIGECGKLNGPSWLLEHYNIVIFTSNLISLYKLCIGVSNNLISIRIVHLNCHCQQRKYTTEQWREGGEGAMRPGRHCARAAFGGANV